MLLAAEYTTTTLAAWIAVALVVGLVIGWLLRPWLVSDRLRNDYEDELRKERADRARVETDLQQQMAVAEEMRGELEELRGDSARLNAELATARSRTSHLEGQVAALAMEKDAEIARLAAEAGKVGPLEVAIGERDARIASLESELGAAPSAADVEQLKADSDRAVAEARTQAEEHESRLRSVRQRAAAEAAAAARELEQASTELALAKARAEEAERTLEALRADRARPGNEPAGGAAQEPSAAVPPPGEPTEVIPRPAEPAAPASAGPAAPQPIEPAVRPASGMGPSGTPTAALEPTPAPTLEAAEAAAVAEPQTADDDDLKLIHGIGPAIERKLKAMGITTYRQIASFSGDDVARVGAALGSFRDRIQRDDWIGSARRLHADRHGSESG